MTRNKKEKVMAQKHLANTILGLDIEDERYQSSSEIPEDS